MKGRPGLEIRAANVADAAGLSELLAAAGQPIQVAELARRLDTIRNGPGTVLIALEWGPPSGVVALHWYPRLHAAPMARIDLLLVGADDRRRGLGRLLLKAAARAARSAGCDALELTAEAGEIALTAFCQTTGFTGCGTQYRRALRKTG